MSDNSNIEWTDHTFNPWIGCTKISPACDHCYAAEWDKRYEGGEHWGAGAPRRRTSASNWAKPKRWNSRPFYECPSCGWRGDDPCTESQTGITEGLPSCPECDRLDLQEARCRVFCASLADVFDNEVPQEWRDDLWRTIRNTPQLDWLLLTKRIGNVQRMLPDDWGDGWSHVWLGITVVTQDEADRDIPKLLDTPTAVRFLSCEPLLGAVDLTGYLMANPDGMRLATGPIRIECRHGYDCCPVCDGDPPTTLDWVIAGGESGPDARPSHPDWFRSLRDQCVAAGVPFHFKQFGEWVDEFHPAADPESQGTSDDFMDIIYDDEGRADDYRGVAMCHVGKKAAGRHLDGERWDEVPT